MIWQGSGRLAVLACTTGQHGGHLSWHQAYLCAARGISRGRQSRGADPSVRTEDYDPYLDPGCKLAIDVAIEDECIRTQLLDLQVPLPVGPLALATGQRASSRSG